MHITLGGTRMSKHQNERNPLSNEPICTTFHSSTKRIPPHTTTEMEQAPPFSTLPLQHQHQQNQLPVGLWRMRKPLDQTTRSFAESSVYEQLRTLLPTLYASNSTSKGRQDTIPQCTSKPHTKCPPRNGTTTPPYIRPWP